MTDPSLLNIESSPKRLTLLYVMALSTVALLALVGQLIVQRAIVGLEGDSRIINLAGRQRMLSQRLVRLALQRKMLIDNSSLPENSLESLDQTLIRELDIWVTHHSGLRFGSERIPLKAITSPEVLKLFEAIEPSFQTIREGIQSSLADLKEPRIEQESNHTLEGACLASDKFLEMMDRIVSRLEHEARARVVGLRQIENLLFVAMLVVLLAEAIFVFSPAVSSLKKLIARLCAITHDLEFARSSAEDANQAKSEFLTKISHELRTPLHAILGMLDLMERNPLRNTQRKRNRVALDAARSLHQLVDDLLDISKIEKREQLALQPVPTAIRPLLMSVSELLRPIADKKGIGWKVEVGDDVPQYVLMDPSRFRQVVVNLLQNAIRYTESGRILCSITMEIRSPTNSIANLESQHESKNVDLGQMLCLTVKDTGVGISEDRQHRIFEPFTQFLQKDDSSTFGKGIGVGLSIVQSIVMRMGGTISLDSQLNVGSTFMIRMPVQLPDASCESSKDDGPIESAVCNTHNENRVRFATGQSNRHSRTALIVDDSTANLTVMRTYLRALGFRTMSVQTLSDARLQLGKYLFDVVLMDKHLPDGDGATILQKLDESNVTPPTRSGAESTGPNYYLITADVHSQTASKTIDGFVGVFQKPISFEQICTILDVHGNQMPDLKDDRLIFSQLQRKLANLVLKGLPADIAEMRSSMIAMDLCRIQFVAHRLKGAAGNASLSNIQLLCADIESMAGFDDVRLEAIFSELEDYCAA